MIAILLVTHGHIGEELISAAQHTFGCAPDRLEAFAVSSKDDCERMEAALRARIQALDDGDGVLLLTDIYGATPANVAGRTVASGRVELVGGVNLPMLLRALNYRHLPLQDLVNKALSGGLSGIVCASADNNGREAKR
jgi:PTS system ascorbate-specific IIA component